MRFHHLPDGPPVFDTAKARARFAAAKADYLAGGSGPEVCERHGLSLRTFRWRARREGWRRADQPVPALAPDPASAPPSQDEPLVMPEAREAPSGTPLETQPPAAPPLTASEMADKAWSMLQAAVAAGRLIEARGWMRLYKDLQPFAREEEAAGRLARMDREDAERRARGEPEPEVDMTGPLPTKALNTLQAELKALTRMAKAARPDDAVAPPLHRFSRPESNNAGPGP